MWTHVEQADIAADAPRIWAIVVDIEEHTRLAGSGEVLAIRMNGPVETGATFEADNLAGEVGRFVSRNRFDVVDAPNELRWTSYPPLDEGEPEDHQIEVTWWFKLSPSGEGTGVEHGFQVPRPRAGAEQLEAFLEGTGRLTKVYAGMRRTLDNLEAQAQG